jgi:hypothetical protein
MTETNKLAKPALEKVQSYSVEDRQLYRTGVYRSGWRISTINQKGKGIYRKRIHQNKATGKPSLVHLLEFGHKWGNNTGYHKEDRCPAYPHVRPTEAEYCEKLFENIKKGINAL